MYKVEKIAETVQREFPAMVEFRRELHQHPELSMEEYETTQRIARELDALGLSYELKEPTGLVGEIKGSQPGKTILLRADIDALPIHEENDHLDYCSQVEGRMHACGHDSHAAMLLTALKALKEVQDDLKGTVRFVFQPGEEVAEGAKAMSNQGAVDGIDHAFGIHIMSGIPSGVVAAVAGESQAACDVAYITFTGHGGHGAYPHQGVDAIVMASSFVMGVQAIVARELDPIHSAVVTVGKIAGGDRFNVIAEKAQLDLTIRTFRPEDREHIEAALRRYADAVATQYRGQAEVDYQYKTQPVINDEAEIALVEAIAKERFGESKFLRDNKSLGAEDFGFYGEAAGVPSVFINVGARNEELECHYPHHHNRFNIDEAAMAEGAEMYALYAYHYLNQAK